MKVIGGILYPISLQQEPAEAAPCYAKLSGPSRDWQRSPIKRDQAASYIWSFIKVLLFSGSPISIPIQGLRG